MKRVLYRRQRWRNGLDKWLYGLRCTDYDFRCIFGNFIRNFYFYCNLATHSMKPLVRALIFLLFFFGCQQSPDHVLSPPTASAQILEPYKWSFKVEQTKPDEATLIFTVKLDSGWHIYSQFITGDGPMPTAVHFKNSSAYKLAGKAEEVG